MAKDRKRYLLIKKAYKATKHHHPDITTQQAYYAGASLIIATIATMIKKHPELLDVLLPQSLESLSIEAQNFLGKEDLRDTFIA